MSFPRINKSLGLLLSVIVLGLSNGVTAVNLKVVNKTAIPIQEARFLTLGGIEQWITIRGSNRANPPNQLKKDRGPVSKGSYATVKTNRLNRIDHTVSSLSRR